MTPGLACGPERGRDQRDGTRRRPARRKRGARAGAAFAAALAAGIVVCDATAAAVSRCEPRAGFTPSAQGISPQPTAQPIELELHEPPVDFEFGSKRGYSDRIEVASASPPLQAGSRVNAEVESDLHRAGGGDTFPIEGVLTQTRVTSSGNVQLFVCLDPEVENVEPGRYTGMIQLTGREIKATAVPLEATLRAPRAPAIAWIVIGLVLGFVVKIAAEARKQSEDSSRTAAAGRVSLRTKARAYLTENAAAIIVATVTGVIFGVVAYLTIYGTSPTWGTNEDIAKIVSAGVLSQVTGMTAAEIVKPPSA